jgi:hypothetical protein
MVAVPYTVPVLLGQEINNGKSHIGLRKRIFYLKCDKIGLTPFRFSGPEIIRSTERIYVLPFQGDKSVADVNASLW